MGEDPTSSSGENARSGRLARVVEDVVRRRSAGERIEDKTVIDAHPELMPELGDELRSLHLLELAELCARDAVEETYPDSESYNEDETRTIRSEHARITHGTEAIPRQIARYTIVREIASGGMGTVYEAIQEQPRRTVAVKVIKQAIASASALRRFEYESHLLANLRHPGIAQVYEAGTHDDGTQTVPYFAMEYIPGAAPITDHAGVNKLGTRERLELFTKVCDAVHHGHQKGIIHRDLKPGNVLVDSSGQPKIIDFGVARSTDSDLALTTIQTDVGQLIGTLQYMSPEQCAGVPHDIDTRSDVYALGVVLYELLCDVRPYDVGHMSAYEAVRVICERQPTKLSTVNRTLRGEIETIVAKSLEKERESRYQSAAELAQDIRRYLAGEAITARPPSIIYQIRVFARRNKALFGAVAAVFAVLVIASVVSTSLYLRAEQARIATVAERDRADAEAQTHKQIKDFLVELFEVSHPGEARGETITAREILDKGVNKIDEELKDQPEVQASLMDTMGTVYVGLGLYDQAKDLLSRAHAMRRRELPSEHPDVAESLNNLAVVLRWTGQLDESERLHGQALAMRRKLFGDEHLAVAESLNNLASVYRDKADFDAAVRLHREALAIRRKLLGTPHADVATSLNDLGSLLQDKGDLDAAEPLYREALEMHRQLLGNDHLDVAVDLHYLAYFLHDKGDYPEAKRMYDEALTTYRKVLGEDHPSVAAVLSSYAALLQDTREYERAEGFLREALAINRKAHGSEHPRVAGDLNTLASVLRDKGDLPQAEQLHREALAMRRKLLGDEHIYVGVTLGSLGQTLTKMGRYEEAEETLMEGHRILNLAVGKDHPRTIAGIKRLVALYDAWGKDDLAARYRAMLPPEEPDGT